MSKSFVSFLFLLGLYAQCNAQGIATDSIAIRTFNSRDYKSSTYNYSAFEDENGIMFFANENGLLEYDGSEWKLTRIADYSGVTIIKQGPDGNIYVGGVNEFGYFKRTKSGGFNYHSLRQYMTDSLDFREVWQIFFLKNQVYFQSYDGIMRYDAETVHTIKVKDSWLIPFDNKILVSTYDKGIGLLTNDSISYFENSLKLKKDAPFKLIPGPNNKYIALTEYNGLFLFDSTNLSFEKWNIEANASLIKTGIYDGIAWDDSTYLFSRTNNGLAWVNNKGKVVRELTKASGLTSNYMREFTRDSRGNVWAATDGLNYITLPNQQNNNNFNTLIRTVEINDTIFNLNSNRGEFTLDNSDQINSLVFHFATPSFDRTELEYSYYLEGYDQGWSAWKDVVNKEYTNLAYGLYTFQVKARLISGEVSSPAIASFSIPQLWYRTRWAYGLAVLIAIGIVVGVIRLRTTQLKNLNARLEKIIDNRTKELIEQKEQLHTLNEELIVANTELDNFVYRSSHDLVAPLKSLKGLIAIAKLEKSPNAQEEYFQMMNTSVNKLEDFIKSILEYSSNSNKEVEKVNVVLNELLDNIILDLKYFDKAENVSIVRDYDLSLAWQSDPKRLQIILSNLIANAIKYHNYNQPNPEIIISAKSIGDRIVVEITDNGQGIDSAHIENIFNMFYRASENSQGSGLGLYIVRDTVHKLNGNISVVSKISKGTTFTLTFAN